MGSNFRKEVTGIEIDKGILDVEGKLKYRLDTKGRGQYASRHEIYGIIAEEMDELLDELRLNTVAGYKNFKKELLDVAVAALFGYICLNGGYIKPPSHKGKSKK